MPTKFATNNAERTLIIAIEASGLNASSVDQSVIGLIIGAASKNVTDCDTVKFFEINRRATGTLPHSHTGKKIPKSEISK